MKMKTLLFTGLILGACAASTAVAQVSTRQAQEVLIEAQRRASINTNADAELKRFDLTFPGGTPAEFIEAINEQAGIRVNVIIPPEHSDEILPPLEVFDVSLPQLFSAVTMANSRVVSVVTGYQNSGSGDPVPIMSRQIVEKSFKSGDEYPTERSIWFFRVSGLPEVSDGLLAMPLKVQVYQLSYLLENYTIEDITTAIKTTWEMLGSKTKPEMKFHEETKLLVAKGTEEQLRMIETVTQQLAKTITPRPPRFP